MDSIDILPHKSETANIWNIIVNDHVCLNTTTHMQWTEWRIKRNSVTCQTAKLFLGTQLLLLHHCHLEMVASQVSGSTYLSICLIFSICRFPNFDSLPLFEIQFRAPCRKLAFLYQLLHQYTHETYFLFYSVTS